MANKPWRKVQKDAVIEGLEGMKANMLERLAKLDEEITEAKEHAEEK